MISNENKNTQIAQTPQRFADSLFIKFYGDLILFLSKPVDLVDLKNKSLFTKMIKKEGTLIYV